MKKLLTLLICFTGLSAAAQEKTINQSLGIGFQLNQYQKDFGYGLNFTSPTFAGKSIALRLRGNLMYLEHMKNEETTWTPYGNVSLGLVGLSGNVTEWIRLYGEGGVLGLLPNQEFSTKDLEIGGYGLFGFEFFLNNSFNYFIEIGGMGAGATADKLPGKPIYSNGLSVGTGFRVVWP